VVHKILRSLSGLSLVAFGRKNVRRSRSLLKKNWILFSTDYLD